jgi:hypothetical protein
VRTVADCNVEIDSFNICSRCAPACVRCVRVRMLHVQARPWVRACIGDGRAVGRALVRVRGLRWLRMSTSGSAGKARRRRGRASETAQRVQHRQLATTTTCGNLRQPATTCTRSALLYNLYDQLVRHPQAPAGAVLTSTLRCRQGQYSRVPLLAAAARAGRECLFAARAAYAKQSVVASCVLDVPSANARALAREHGPALSRARTGALARARVRVRTRDT